MGKDLQVYECTMTLPCNTHACYERSSYIIARKDLDIGTALATGVRICEGCARNLVNNAPTSLIETEEDRKAKFAQEAAELAKLAELAAKAEADQQEALAAIKAEAEGQISLVSDEKGEVSTVVEPDAEEEEVEEEGTEYRCLDCNRDFQNKGSYVRHMNSAVHRK